MKTIRRAAALAALVLILQAFAGTALADVAAEKTEERGRVTQITWKDENGMETAGPEGYATVRYSYDYLKTTEMYFDAEGNPFRTAGGYCGRTLTRDGRNQLGSIEYLDANGDLTLNSLGYAMVSYTYFTFNAGRTAVYYGTDRRPVLVPSLGYAQVENEYSGTTLTGRKYMNETGELTDIPAGYSAMKKKMNRSRQIIRTWYVHADGSPAEGPDGWYACETDRDNRGRVTETRYLDTDGNLTDKGGTARETRAYGRDGMMRITRYNSRGEKISFGGNSTSLRLIMKNDRIMQEIYLNEADEPAELPEGYSMISYTYNKAGLPEIIQYQDAAGQNTTCAQGYSAIRQVWDAEGRLLSRIYLDESGATVESEPWTGDGD